MKTQIKLARLNQKIDFCPIERLKRLSNQKTKLIYTIYNEIMIREQFPLSTKEKLKALKNEVEQISTILQERAYLDAEKIKLLSQKKKDLELKIFTLELS